MFYSLTLSFGLQVEPCCFAKLVHFLWEQDRLAEFHSFLKKGTGDPSESTELPKVTLRERIWLCVEEPFSSTLAKVRNRPI
jgi:hypothetical protein